MTPTRTRIGATTAALTLLLVSQSGAGSNAAYSDTAPTTSGVVSAATLPSPQPPTAGSSCSASNGILNSSLTLSWGGITPQAGMPPLTAYEYQLRFLDRNNANQLLTTVTVAHTGPAGNQQSHTLHSGAFANLLGLNLLSTNRITTQIRSHLLGTSWYGSTSTSVNWTTTTVLGVTAFNCLQ
jgi:hypothetical protein